ncbi:MAG: endo-1,4-beta-xylanase [Clostridia bacterium]|nr:endo-1,4-beta-xylanase [Clostridia bacterium]
MRKLLLLVLILFPLLLFTNAICEENAVLYQSDFSSGSDGWYARSTGGARLKTTQDGTLAITGRSDNWHSPGRDFALAQGVRYELSVQVRQSEKAQARFMFSVAHSLGGFESYENLGSATVKKDEWTTITGSYTAGLFDRFVLYVETSDAPSAGFEIRDFRVTSAELVFAEEETIPALKDVYAGRFDFGTAVTFSELFNAERMAFYASQFNIMTPGNEMKPDYILDVFKSAQLAKTDETAAAVRFDSVKPLLDYAKVNGIKVHGHVLVWHQQTPEAFFHEGYSPAKPLVSREVLLARLDNYVKNIMTYLDENYPGVVVSWDVVNEAIDDGSGKLRDSKWLTIVGEDYVARAFEIARRHAPEGTLLFYNDYNTAILIKQMGILNLLKELIPEGNIDGYGFQMHHDVSFPSTMQIAESVRRIAETGLKLRVSELDVTIPDMSEESYARQAKMYAQIMNTLELYKDQLLAVQVWGVTDDLSWRASQYPLLFDGKAQPKPAFWAVVDPSSSL